MRLLIDIGNRRLKWAVSDCGNRLSGSSGAFVFQPESEQALQAMPFEGLDPAPTSVWISCVAKPVRARRIAEWMQATWQLQPVFISSVEKQGCIVNGYAQPATLGSDRWAALVAADYWRIRHNSAVIVIDAGTAVTVDLLDIDGRFCGGVILPGLYSMLAALNEQSELEVTMNDTFSTTALATNTHSAVTSGAWFAVLGGVNLVLSRQREALPVGCNLWAIITGGDADRLALGLECRLAKDIRVEPNLVLQGLAIIATEGAL